MRRLVRILVLSGFGMTICGGSYPASQGEHLLSHYVEMMGPPELPHTFHGEQIGVCALAIARLQDAILASDTPPRLAASSIDRAAVLAHFGPALGDTCWRELSPKLLSPAAAAELNARLSASWPSLRAQLAAVTLGAPAMAAILAAAGAAITPADLSWPPSLFASAMSHARDIRNRYTFLDLAADRVSAVYPSLVVQGNANPID